MAAAVAGSRSPASPPMMAGGSDLPVFVGSFSGMMMANTASSSPEVRPPASVIIPSDAAPRELDLEMFQDVARLINVQREEIEIMRKRVIRMDVGDQQEIESCRRQMRKDREERVAQVGAFSIEMETKCLRKIDVLHHEVEGFTQEHMKEDDTRQQHQLDKCMEDYGKIYLALGGIIDSYGGMMENFLAESDRLQRNEDNPDLLEEIPPDDA